VVLLQVVAWFNRAKTMPAKLYERYHSTNKKGRH